MTEAASSVLTPWSNFYILTGSAAGALTGLMFVVITLVSGEGRPPSSRDGFSAFSTPTVVHFSISLLVSAIISAPWPALIGPATLLGIAGAYGIAFMARQMVKAQRLTQYSPDVEDWICYSVLPFVAYGAILAGGVVLARIPAYGLYALAGGVLLLTLLGIRNAWDIVTYLAVSKNDSD